MRQLSFILSIYFLFNICLVNCAKICDNEGRTNARLTTQSCPIVTENPTNPCPNNDVACVSAYFQANSDCPAFDTTASSDLDIPENKFYLPFFNVIIDLNMTVSGLENGVIESFIVDDSTDRVLLTVDYSDVSVVLHKADYVYYQRGTQPKLIGTSSTIYFESFTITSTFPGARNPQLSNSVHIGDLAVLPQYTIDVCSQYAEDPAVTDLLTKFEENTVPAAVEAFLTLARPFQSKFIRSKLCNFASV